MNIENFIKLRPNLYHLTKKENLAHLLESGKFYSTNELIDLSGNPDYQEIKTLKRNNHYEITINEKVYSIRDQKPISEKNLIKCLEDNMSCGDFYKHLNNRVFMWSRINFLNNHYNTYKNENPIILKFDTRSILEANTHVKFCRLNSGATRSSSHHQGAPPPRGLSSFLNSEEYLLPAATVKEVTFEKECKISGPVYISETPFGKYKEINF